MMNSYRLFGRSGLRVSPLCLGTMTFGTKNNWGSSQRESRKVLDLYIEHGGNFLDTANFYTGGESEEWLGKFLKGRRERLVIGTKYTLHTDPTDPNANGNHRKNIHQEVEKSLKRLQTDYIDIYWVHAWDHLTPAEEVMRSLDDLVRAGKILYIGISDTPAWIVSRCNTIAELRGWTSFTGLQLEYSLHERTIESEFFPLANTLDLALTAWSPLAMGVLTGKYHDKKSAQARFNLNPEWGKQYLTSRTDQIVKEVIAIAEEINATPAQVAIRWLLEKSPIVIPIVGAKNVSQLEDSLGAFTIALTSEHINRLNQVSAYPLSFPHGFLTQPNIQTILFGENAGKILSHRRQVC